MVHLRFGIVYIASEEINSGILLTIDIDRLVLRVKSRSSIVMGYGQKFEFQKHTLGIVLPMRYISLAAQTL